MILSVEPRSVQRVRKGNMEVSAIDAIPTSYSKEYSTQTVSKVDDDKHKITNTIYNVTTYDRNGKLDTFTNIRYLDYVV
jgi:hypothetical protein